MVPSDLQKVYIRPTKVYIEPKKVYIRTTVYIRPMKIVNPTYKKCTSDLK